MCVILKKIRKRKGLENRIKEHQIIKNTQSRLLKESNRSLKN